MTNDGGTYAYDAANRMKTAGGTNYGFDGDGRRVRVQQGGYSSIYYLWSSVLGQPVAEIVGDTGAIFQAYVYSASGQMLALLSNDGGFYWSHQDHLGSGRKLTDSTGAVRYRGEFDPHGQVLLEVTSGGTGTYASSHKYTGYEREWSTNLDYAQARMYSHNRARFMQPDPLGIGAADLSSPQTLNSYSYVANDPVNFVDPSGLNAIFCEPDTMTCDPNTGVCTIRAGACHLVGGGGGIGPIGPWDPPQGGGGGGGATGGGGFDWSLFSDLVSAAAALQKAPCRNLFGSDVDPIRLLGQLASGTAGLGSISRGDLGAGSNNNVTAAETTGILGSRSVTRPDGTTFRQSIFTGANIVLNNNAASPYQHGYGGRFGVSNAVNRAITLIHELGHAAAIIYGANASRIADDQNNARQSQANSQLVYDNCFR